MITPHDPRLAINNSQPEYTATELAAVCHAIDDQLLAHDGRTWPVLVQVSLAMRHAAIEAAAQQYRDVGWIVERSPVPSYGLAITGVRQTADVTLLVQITNGIEGATTGTVTMHPRRRLTVTTTAGRIVLPNARDGGNTIKITGLNGHSRATARTVWAEMVKDGYKFDSDNVDF